MIVYFAMNEMNL